MIPSGLRVPIFAARCLFSPACFEPVEQSHQYVLYRFFSSLKHFMVLHWIFVDQKRGKNIEKRKFIVVFLKFVVVMFVESIYTINGFRICMRPLRKFLQRYIAFFTTARLTSLKVFSFSSGWLFSMDCKRYKRTFL